MLSLDEVYAGYRGLQILQGVTLHVEQGEIVALVGANGAGKTTTMRTVSGLLRPTRGTITLEGVPCQGLRPDRIVRRGLVQVPEGRALYGGLTVAENLAMGAYHQDAKATATALTEVHELFPILKDRSRQIADTMSGGQQQMLAIGRALMARPKLLMLDEPSIGLAPILVQSVFTAIQHIRDAGVTVLLVEQNAAHALAISDRAYVMETGTIVLEGAGPQLLKDPRVRSAYLGH